MLATVVSNETRMDSKAAPYYCQVKSKAIPDPTAVFDRILQTLGAKNAPEAARTLGLSKQSVYDWQKSVPGLDNLLRIAKSGNASLHWLLTGEGDKHVVQAGRVSFDELLESRIREIVREEIVSSNIPIQQIGVVDEFDLEAAVRKYDTPGLVLKDWYSHDHIEMPGIESTAFSGWEKMTLEEKIQEIKGARSIQDRQREFRKHASSTKPKTIK
jgi:hypothetical protein